jgi:hypothetical protein
MKASDKRLLDITENDINNLPTEIKSRSWLDALKHYIPYLEKKYSTANAIEEEYKAKIEQLIKERDDKIQTAQYALDQENTSGYDFSKLQLDQLHEGVGFDIGKKIRAKCKHTGDSYIFEHVMSSIHHGRYSFVGKHSKTLHTHQICAAHLLVHFTVIDIIEAYDDHEKHSVRL